MRKCQASLSQMQRSFVHTHALMDISNSVDCNTSEGSQTRHDLERFTSLGTMLSCTIYG